MAAQLDRVVAAEDFAVAVGLLTRSKRELGRAAGRLTGSLLHAVNLPSKGDVDRPLMQVASVDRELRRLQRSMAEDGAADARLPR